jgi:hypothetical protein
LRFDNAWNIVYDEDYYFTKGIQMTEIKKSKGKSNLEPMVKVSQNRWTRVYAQKPKHQHHHTTGTEFVISTGADAKPVATFTNTYPVDKEKFCKIWVAALMANVKLTTAGRKVFVVLFTQVQKNIGKDMVQMAYSHVNEVDIEISQATYARGVRNLYDNEFIDPVEGLASTWFINPNYIFNGNRLNINNTYVLKETVDQETGEIQQMEEHHDEMA